MGLYKNLRTRYNYTYMAYSKSRAAQQLGIGKKEFEKRAERAGFDNTEDYWNSIGGDSAPLQQAITKELIALDRQLDELGPLGLTDEEKQQFLEKAIQEVQPYYDRKSAELEAGLKEGKVRTAEDILLTIREVEEEVSSELAYYDLQSAQTEEEFINRISDITSTGEEDLALKQNEWTQRLEDVRTSQVQAGTLTSGIGGIERQKEETTRELELQRLQRRTEAEATRVETGRKYDVENIRLAREKAEQDRIRQIGDPGQTAATRAAARETAGLGVGEELGSVTEVERLRKERAITPVFDKTRITDLEEERRKGVESRKQELQAGELAPREQEREFQREKVLATAAQKRRELDRLRG